MNITTKKGLLASLVGVFAATGGVGSAIAQGGEAATRQSAIDEIVVTATKRETSLQDTAMSLSVVTGEDLQNRGFTNPGEFINTIPGLAVTTQQPGVLRINMRGVSTSNVNVGRNTTAVYIDEFPLSEAARDIRLIDVERVEVLKGPQGTLYGQSSMGGTIRYITNKPSDEGFSGDINSYVSSYGDSDGLNYGLNGHINMPLTDNLTLRAVAYRFDNDGYVDYKGAFPEEDGNKEETNGGRLALKWDISDSVALNYMYLNQRVDSGEARISETFDLTPTGPVVLQAPDFDNFSDQNGNGILVTDEVHNLKLDIGFETFDLAVLASKKEFFFQRLSQQGSYLNFTDNQQAFQLSSIRTNDTNFEIRLTSQSDGSEFFSWIAGIWYNDSEKELLDLVYHAGDDASFFGLFDVSEGFVYRDAVEKEFNKELAIYGEVAMHLTEQATLTLGYRRADVEVDRESLRSDGPLGTAVAAQIGLDQYAQEDVDTYKVNFEYTLSDDILLYALAASGYRAGGFNVANLHTAGVVPPYESDSLWNYEIGARTSWLDNRLIANAVVYLIDWEDMQLTKQIIDENGFTNATDNIGKARVEGLELEVDYRLSEYLSFGVNYAYTDTTLEEDVPGENAFKGDRLPGSAKHVHSLFIDYVRPITDEMDVDVRFTQRYIGDRVTVLGGGEAAQKASITPSYDTTDLKVGVRHANGIEASLFANNIFNNIGITWREATPLYERLRITSPRVVGLNVGYKF